MRNLLLWLGVWTTMPPLLNLEFLTKQKVEDFKPPRADPPPPGKGHKTTYLAYDCFLGFRHYYLLSRTNINEHTKQNRFCPHVFVSRSNTNRKSKRFLSDEIWRPGCLSANTGSQIPEPGSQPWNPKPRKF